MTWTAQATDSQRRARDILARVRLKREPVNEKRAVWLSELRRIAEDVSTRAALSESEADNLVNEAIHETRESKTT